MTRSPSPAGRRGWVEDARQRLSPAVGAGLRDARLTLGLSFRAAARRAGVSAGYLCQLEHGSRCPSVAVADALVDALRLDGATADRLFCEARPDAGRSWGGAARSDFAKLRRTADVT